MQVGKRVREIRLKRKMTVAGLAEASHLTKGFISQVESGRSNPSLASLGRISQALDVPLSRLISSDDDGLGREPSEGPMVIPTGNLYHELSGLTALTGAHAGTHFLATIPPRHALSGSANSAPVTQALTVVLKGAIKITQGTLTASASGGALSTWDSSSAYALENRGREEAILLIFLPTGVARPTLVPLRAHTGEPTLPGGRNASAEGPLRLVAMRAQRQAERRR